uniref:Potential ABC transporter n=1 Tax=Ganoderma boninense TaxID=34458 RepID=A0A5K1JVH3_9APHY|nr:Potential ABC transporter [Ganoderma boninense]
MTPPDTRPGGICGWTPADDNCDALYTTIPSPASHASLIYGPDTPSPSPSPSSPPTSVAAASRSVSPDTTATEPDEGELAQNISPYYNATSLRRYKAKLKLDPKWAPRPPNAFILFRREYAERHKGEELQSPEKTTLSKRAGKAWHSLTSDEQKVWYDAAKQQAEDHQRLNPGYIFKPNKRTRSDHRKHPAMRSRREQVEEFVRKSTDRRCNPAKRGRHTSPASVASSASPEPPDTPATSRSRSCSNPPQVACPVPITPGGNNVLLSGDPFASMSSLLERPVCSSKELAYSDNCSPYFVFDDNYTESSDDLSEFWYDSFAPSPVPYYMDGTPDHMPSPMSVPVQVPEAQFASSFELPSPSASQGASYIPSTSAPLITRRRRSATTSMIPTSTQHAAVTSSLYGWARDDLATARMAPQPDLGAARPPISPDVNPHPKAGQAAESAFLPLSTADDVWGPPRLHPGASAAYKLHDDTFVAGMDPDRTPRGSICAAHEAAPAPHSFADYSLAMAAPPQDMYISAAFDPFDATGDLESYGVCHYGVREANGAYAPTQAVEPYSLYLTQGGQQD